MDKKCERERWKGKGYFQAANLIEHLQWYLSTMSPGQKLCYPNLVEALCLAYDSKDLACQSTPKETPPEPAKCL